MEFLRDQSAICPHLSHCCRFCPTAVLCLLSFTGGSYQGAHGGQDGEQPPPEQTWWKKNWLYIVGGGMVIMNVATAVLKPQPGAAGAAGAAGGAAGAARRG